MRPVPVPLLEPLPTTAPALGPSGVICIVIRFRLPFLGGFCRFAENSGKGLGFAASVYAVKSVVDTRKNKLTSAHMPTKGLLKRRFIMLNPTNAFALFTKYHVYFGRLHQKPALFHDIPSDVALATHLLECFSAITDVNQFFPRTAIFTPRLWLSTRLRGRFCPL